MVVKRRRTLACWVALSLAAAPGCSEHDEPPESSEDDVRQIRRSSGGGGPSSSRPSASSDATDTRIQAATAPDAPKPGDAQPAAAVDAGSAAPPAERRQRVTIRFRARFGLSEFDCGQSYRQIGSANTTVTPQDLRFFVSELALIRDDGQAVSVALDQRKPWQAAELGLLDLEDGTGSCGEGDTDLNTQLTGSVPEGDYNGISFVNGVPEALNHIDPLKAEDPLRGHPELSWGWLGGFRFTKIELREVVPPNQAYGHAQLRIGSTGCSGDAHKGTVKCDKANRNHVVLRSFDHEFDSVVLDLERLFEQTDLTEKAECDATGEECAPMFKAFGIDFASGDALETQAVYRVE